VTRHTVGAGNPVRVTGADRYRITLTFIVLPHHLDFAVLEEFIAPEHRDPAGYGIALLESEEHSLTYVGPVQQIRDYDDCCAADPTRPVTLDTTRGVICEFWPHGEGWDDLIPATTWHPGGEGILVEFDHPLGGRVVVYEYLEEDADGTRMPRVGFHCERCCRPVPGIDHEARIDNLGPRDRRIGARHARLHIHDHEHECRRRDPRIAQAVTHAANRIHGTNDPVLTHESRCATTGPCSRIRHLRART
jgi:hypothetical protein